MTFSSRIKRIILSPACFGPSPTLDDPEPASALRRAPAAPPELQPRGPQPGMPPRRSRLHWYSRKSSLHHGRPTEGPAKAPPTVQQPAGVNLCQVLDGAAASPAPAQPPFRINTRVAPDRMAEEQVGTRRPEHTLPRPTETVLALEQPPAALPVAQPPRDGPRFDENRSSSPRMEPPVAQPTVRPSSSMPQIWPLPMAQDPLGAQDSFDRRTGDSLDETRHGPVNRRFWRSLTLQPSAIPDAFDPHPPAAEYPSAPAPEVRRGAGADALRLAGVLAGHTARQVVATGTSTLVREGINIGITMGLRNRPGLAAGLTLSMTLMNLLAQLQREKRVLRAPDEAARGFHSLSPAQWQAASHEQQAALRREQQASSRRVTRLHLLSNLITTSIAMVGAARPGGRIGAMAAPLPSALLGQMARQWAYVGLRDGLQATFTTVQTREPSPLPNTQQQRMRTAAATYGGVQALLGYAQDAIMPRVLGALSQGSNTIRASGGLLSSVGSGALQWARTIAAVASVRAGINTIGETVDDAQLTHHDAAEAGSEQVLGLDVRGLDPARRDYGRLLDHAMVRVFANDVVGGAMNAVGLAAGQLPARFADVASFVGNFGVGYLINLTYPLVGNNFAAAGLVREAVRPPPPVDPEAGAVPVQHPSATPSRASHISQVSSYYRPEA
jgi:hypothetical protein